MLQVGSIRGDIALVDRFDVEVLLEDSQRGGSRRFRTESSVFDDRADSNRRRVGRSVTAPPRLAQKPGLALDVDDFLRRTRLAGDCNWEMAKDAGGGAI